MQIEYSAKMDAEEENKRADMQIILDRQVNVYILPRRGMVYSPYVRADVTSRGLNYCFIGTRTAAANARIVCTRG